ncbi:putative protein N(5)-glutamine methyltransferase [Kineococcus gynurae]|uniref:Methyltransferase small domain-containing protein n=1 Tax=Kineococcus gynurae TaxID=452979 RepID=A0ABV5LWI9_9ACTN
MTDPDERLAVVTRLRAAGCVWAEEETDLLLAAAGSAPELRVLVERRVAGEPLEHVLGGVVFAGVRIRLGPGVFVPRRRTEALVRSVLARVGPGDVVVDLCCGAGAIGAAVLAAAPAVEVWAADVDPVAVGWARRNLPADRVRLGDLDAPLPVQLRGGVAVLVANVPYVPRAAIALLPPEAREHEPRWALDGGPDGLDVLRRLAAVAPGWLRPGGVLLSEVADPQVSGALAALEAAGLSAAGETGDRGDEGIRDDEGTRDDETDGTVVVVGTQPSAAPDGRTAGSTTSP